MLVRKTMHEAQVITESTSIKHLDSNEKRCIQTVGKRLALF